MQLVHEGVRAGPAPCGVLASVLLWSHCFFMLPDEQASPKQIEILRTMTGARRLRLAERLYWSARRLKIAGLHAQHPDWTQERLEAETRRIFLHART